MKFKIGDEVRTPNYAIGRVHKYIGKKICVECYSRPGYINVFCTFKNDKDCELFKK